MKKRITVLILLVISGLGAILAFYILARNKIALGCIFYQLTGLQCPGCGNSRALIALLEMNFKKAISYNLMFPLEIGYLIWVVIQSGLSFLNTGRFSYKPKKIWIDATILIMVIAWGFIRNIY